MGRLGSDRRSLRVVGRGMGRRASIHCVRAIIRLYGNSPLMSCSFTPLKRSPPDQTKPLVRAAVIELFTLRRARVRLSHLSRIPQDAIFYNLVKLGYSQEKGVQVWYPDVAMEAEILDATKPNQTKTTAGDEEKAEGLEADTAAMGEDATISEAPSPGSQEAADLPEQSRAGSMEAVGSSQADSDQDGTVELDGAMEEAGETEMSHEESAIFNNGSWLRIPLEPIGLKFAVCSTPESNTLD